MDVLFEALLGGDVDPFRVWIGEASLPHRLEGAGNLVEDVSHPQRGDHAQVGPDLGESGAELEKARSLLNLVERQGFPYHRRHRVSDPEGVPVDVDFLPSASLLSIVGASGPRDPRLRGPANGGTTDNGTAGNQPDREIGSAHRSPRL